MAPMSEGAAVRSTTAVDTLLAKVSTLTTETSDKFVPSPSRSGVEEDLTLVKLCYDIAAAIGWPYKS